MRKKLLLSFALFSALISTAQNPPTANVSIIPPAPHCNPGSCVQLVADYTTLKSTNNYTVSSIPYNPSFPFTIGTPLDTSNDDVWSPLVTLPFSFCFYGNNYNTLLVGSNGVITFDTVNQSAGGQCPYAFVSAIPDPMFPIKNAIYGVYQDTNIASPPVTNPIVQNVNYYILDVGVHTAPNRVFVINFNQLPLYGCDASNELQTSQIVMYESTNIIDVFVANRTICNNTFNNGNGLIGLQNRTGTAAITPAGRNTGNWTTTNEAWRFKPNGGNLPVIFNWFQNDIPIAGQSGSSLTVCPQSTNLYKVAVSYPTCGTTTTIESPEVALGPIIEPGFSNTVDISVCVQDAPPYVVDLSVNSATVLSALNPDDYILRYYENQQDAQNVTPNNILNISNYVFSENRTIYISIESALTGCVYVKSFTISIVEPLPPPTGNVDQTLIFGQTISDLAVTGQNVVWYDAPVSGNVLAGDTVLQDNVTYYAATFDPSTGCTGRNIQSTRLGVTVHLVLGNQAFHLSELRIYPNPISTVLNVSAASKIKSIEIFNTLGQRVMTQQCNSNDVKIDVAHLSRGVYFVKVNAGQAGQILKVIKN